MVDTDALDLQEKSDNGRVAALGCMNQSSPALLQAQVGQLMPLTTCKPIHSASLKHPSSTSYRRRFKLGVDPHLIRITQVCTSYCMHQTMSGQDPEGLPDTDKTQHIKRMPDQHVHQNCPRLLESPDMHDDDPHDSKQWNLLGGASMHPCLVYVAVTFSHCHLPIYSAAELSSNIQLNSIHVMIAQLLVPVCYNPKHAPPLETHIAPAG
jgi:hypothetical protein